MHTLGVEAVARPEPSAPLLARGVLLFGAVMLVVAGCSGDDAPSATVSVGSDERVSTSAAASDPSSSSTTTTTTTTPTTTTVVPTTVIPTVPESGVPGIDSTDRFCRSWSEFAGTFQTLALASNLADDPASAARAEVAAAPVVVGSVGGLDEFLPAELESERTALVDGLAGPLERRAQRAIVALGAAGVTDAELVMLGDAWLTALSGSGADDPDIAVVVAPELGERVDDAAVAFALEVPPIPDDPSLITSAQVPLTEQYLSANCPDQGTLAGNDVIDS